MDAYSSIQFDSSSWKPLVNDFLKVTLVIEKYSLGLGDAHLVNAAVQE